MKQFAAKAALGLAALAAPVFAHAQTLGGITPYGTLGYAATSEDNGYDLPALQARLGAKFGTYWGLEGEFSTGLKRDKTSVAGVNFDAKLREQTAAYAVGFYPLTPKIDLLARIGYGQSQIHYGAGTSATLADRDSFNYGVGGQYKFDDKNGLRLDYTRRDYQSSSAKDDVLAVSFVRSF